jgi:UDP:flavonoid glycosyltransferase YjiC (YdhE family)
VVCHAGNGTIYQALSHGKPVVGVPDFHDQEFNMQRVEARDLGLTARTGPRLVENIVSGVQRIMADASYRERAGKVRDILSGRRSAQEAADRITAFVG